MRLALTLALLVLAAPTTGCLGGDGGGAAGEAGPAPAQASGDGSAPRNGTGGGNGTAGSSAGGGNGTAQEPPNGTSGAGNGTAPNATDDGPRKGQVVAEGHIAAGSPTTYVRSVTVLTGREGVDSFRWEADLPKGTVLATNTTANQGGPYNVDIYFHDANGSYLGGCNAAGNGEESCEVPEGAAQGTVDAAWGVDLDVVLYVKEPP